MRLKPLLSLLLLFSILSFSSLKAQTGGIIVESQVVESDYLGEEVHYSIYFPQDYIESNRRYPVLYLLHGFTDNHTAWTQFGQVKATADASFDDLDVTSMIIVMPDAGLSWYTNNYDESLLYETFFIEELIPHIDENYRTRSESDFRALAGLSMGGYGSLLYAIKHPGLFTAAASLSAGVYTDEEIINMDQRRWDYLLGTPFGEGHIGHERLHDHYLANSILYLAEQADPEELSRLGIYMDCGDQDFLIKGNMALHALLRDRDIPNEFRIRDGGHTWSYWRSGLPDVLRFVSERFQR